MLIDDSLLLIKLILCMGQDVWAKKKKKNEPGNPTQLA